jgi:hypothetical protein
VVVEKIRSFEEAGRCCGFLFVEERGASLPFSPTHKKHNVSDR